MVGPLTQSQTEAVAQKLQAEQAAAGADRRCVVAERNALEAEARGTPTRCMLPATRCTVCPKRKLSLSAMTCESNIEIALTVLQPALIHPTLLNSSSPLARPILLPQNARSNLQAAFDQQVGLQEEMLAQLDDLTAQKEAAEGELAAERANLARALEGAPADTFF